MRRGIFRHSVRIRSVFQFGLLGLLMSQPAAANVLTESLHWQAESVVSGLLRLKEQFLDESVRRDREFVGGVFRTRSGTYAFTQGRGRSGQNEVTFRIQPPAGTELIGFWHTHGADGLARELFSATDADLVRSFGLPFYLIDPDGEIRVLRPEHVASRRDGRLRGMPRGSYTGERLPGRQPEPDPDVIEV